jgi:hypothetical protein
MAATAENRWPLTNRGGELVVAVALTPRAGRVAACGRIVGTHAAGLSSLPCGSLRES